MDETKTIFDEIKIKEFEENDLLKIDNLFKQSDFQEIVILFKKEYIHKLNSNLNYNSHDENIYFIQTLLSIYVYSLLKLQKYDQISDVYNKFNFSFDQSIFPFKFLEAKYYFMIVSKKLR